eukprot:COSAG02_NODE_36223_length_457_cov_1.013966_1_plen_103_part_10
MVSIVHFVSSELTSVLTPQLCIHHVRGDSRTEHSESPVAHTLLRNPPDPDAETNIVCKVADFGLSRDKHVTDDERRTGITEYREGGTEQMTGCGSVLWMAPEI